MPTTAAIRGTSKSLSSYNFDTGNSSYSNVPGPYPVALWPKHSSNLSPYTTLFRSVVAPTDAIPPTISAQLNGMNPGSSFQVTQGQVLPFSGSVADNVAQIGSAHV